MKMIEIKLRSQTAELEKLTAKKERAEAMLQKATAKAEKMGVAEWSMEEYRAYVDTMDSKDGWFTDKKQIEKKAAWSDRWSAERELNDIIESIERAENRFEKTETEVETYRAKVKSEMDAKAYEELMKVSFEQEQKEWAKDGINLEKRYFGTTPNGKRFWIEGNNGFTDRSRHCFTLTIDGETIFTSGEFWRCYSVIKNR